MAITHSINQPGNPENAPVYLIRITGQLDPDWSVWMNGLEIYLESIDPAVTCLTGPIVDQARLRGILNRIWDLNLSLVSVNRVE
jgi:hypothetical protein